MSTPYGKDRSRTLGKAGTGASNVRFSTPYTPALSTPVASRSGSAGRYGMSSGSRLGDRGTDSGSSVTATRLQQRDSYATSPATREITRLNAELRQEVCEGCVFILWLLTYSAMITCISVLLYSCWITSITAIHCNTLVCFAVPLTSLFAYLHTIQR